MHSSQGCTRVQCKTARGTEGNGGKLCRRYLWTEGRQKRIHLHSFPLILSISTQSHRVSLPLRTSVSSYEHSRLYVWDNFYRSVAHPFLHFPFRAFSILCIRIDVGIKRGIHLMESKSRGNILMVKMVQMVKLLKPVKLIKMLKIVQMVKNKIECHNKYTFIILRSFNLL